MMLHMLVFYEIIVLGVNIVVKHIAPLVFGVVRRLL
jgi:hypothetical protein